MLAVLLVLALVWAFLPRGADATTGDPVLLNEILISHDGPDDTEFVELYGVPGTPLTGLSLVAVEGDGSGAGTIDLRIDLPAGATLGANGFYLVGNPAGLVAHYAVTPDLSVTQFDATLGFFEQGSQTVALVQTATVGGQGTTLTGAEVAVDAVGLRDAFGTDTWYFGAPLVGPWDGFVPPGAHRFPDGAPTWVLADFYLGPDNTPTPATPYVAPTPEPTPMPTPEPTTEPTPEPTPAPVPPPGASTAALWSMANQLMADGLSAGRCKLLTDRLERVDRFMESGHDAAAATQLQAFDNQVMGLSPRWISEADAEALVAEADSLRATLAP